MAELAKKGLENVQIEKDKKKLQTGICRIWKSLPSDQGGREPMKGNGVLVCDQKFMLNKLGVNAEYAILTSRKTCGEDDDKICDYQVEFPRLKEPGFKKPVSVNSIMYSLIPKGSLVFLVLDTNKVKQSLFNNSTADRAFGKIDEVCHLGPGDVFCHYVTDNSFEVKHCKLKCCKSECGDLVINMDPTSLADLPLGSLILNDQKEVLGVLGEDSNGKYVVNTVVAAATALKEAQGISCITNIYS